MSTYSDGGRIEVDGPDGFRMIPDTMLFNIRINDLDVRLYGVLLWHGRGGHGIFPGRKVLAQELDKKSVRTIDAAFERLQAEGYLTIHARYNDDGGQDRNLYRLHFHSLPPEQRQVRRASSAAVDPQVGPPAQKIARGSDTEVPEAGGAENCTGGGATDCTGPAQKSAHQKRKEPKGKEDQEKENPLPAVGDLTRRKARAAAVPAGKDNQASTTGMTASGQLAAAAAPAVPPPPPTLTVFAALPQALRRRIGADAKGKVLSAIAREIGVHGRTMAEMVERVGRRWEGWQRMNPHSRISNPLAVALTLVERRHCANARCEDGLDLDSGTRCTACSGRGPRRTAPGGEAGPAPVVPLRGANGAGQRVVTQAPTFPPVAEVLAFRPKPEPEPQEVFHLTPPAPERPAKAQALQAARQAVGHRPLTARDRELQDAMKIMCPLALCGADEGALCVSRDGVELLLRHTHGARVIEARQRRLAGTLDDEVAATGTAAGDAPQPEGSA
ncbi:hypothetical protein [Planomonospora sp. ID82291]|uniref:hypothetical protein n=1 Tax=Planomonospora sp. ID82291 TaxID=2738136 RepID=UPI0018C3F904|nr:hypothetical protein [Planomonospora sp. ID82291]MBG0818719.1 hypothetical protein [Planomonospora sp. ID82291]